MKKSILALLGAVLVSTNVQAATVKVSCFTDHAVTNVVRGTTEVAGHFWKQATVELEGEFRLHGGQLAAIKTTFDLRREPGQFMIVTGHYQLWNPYLGELESFSQSSHIYNTFTVYQNRRVNDAESPHQVKGYSLHCDVKTRS